MPAINFKKQFADLVESGEKRQTIRLVWKYPIKSGDTLYLKIGMRTKQCRKLGEAICKSVQPIKINPCSVILNEKNISGNAISELAKADGFKRYRDFFEFFEKQYGLPFKGVLIKW